MKMLLGLLVLAAACGSKSPAAGTTRAGGEGGAVGVLPNVPFDDLDREQRIEFMKQKVVPAMRPIFQDHDATKYAEFGCPTCHGPGANDGKFKLPNPDLPKLNFTDLSKFDNEDLEWMNNEVLPTMAKILGEERASADNPKGFNCLECHQEEGK